MNLRMELCTPSPIWDPGLCTASGIWYMLIKHVLINEWISEWRNEYLKVQTNEFTALFTIPYCHCCTVLLVLRFFKSVKMMGNDCPFNRSPIYPPVRKRRFHVTHKFRSGKGWQVNYRHKEKGQMDYEVSESKCAFPGRAFIHKPAKIYWARPGSTLCQAWGQGPGSGKPLFLCLRNSVMAAKTSMYYQE